MVERIPIRYTRHARQQMEQRGIREEEVLMALNEPEETTPGQHSDEIIAIRHYGRRRVRVIYVSEPGEIRIITVTR